MTISKGPSKYRFGLVAVQGVRWDRGGITQPGKYTFLYGRVNENHDLCSGLLCIREYIISTVKRV
jgi:hypothetical protein